MMDLVEYPDRDMLMLGLADRLASSLRRDLAVKDRVSFSVPGGTTPGPVFDMLSAVDLNWDRVDVILNDERWVPESSERSNTALLRRRLLTGAASSANLVPLRSDEPTPEEGLAALMPRGTGSLSWGSQSTAFCGLSPATPFRMYCPTSTERVAV